MKSRKPFLLVLAGVLITVAIFSFKSEEPKKEYCRIEYYDSNALKADIIYPDKVQPLEIPKSSDKRVEIVKLINKLSSEGWTVTCAASRFAGSMGYQGEIIYLERTKQ